MMSNKWLTTVIAIIISCVSIGAFAEPESEKFPWAQSAPTIEELTDGQIKTGQKVTKDNMQLVKDYMPIGMDTFTADGAEWIIAPHTPSEQLIIPGLIEATHRNAGKALVKPDGSVYAADGSPWYGGFPVLDPKTGIDVMANRLYNDHDNTNEIGYAHWTTPDGEVYKVITAHLRAQLMNGRVCAEPVRQHAGFEGELRREVLIFEAPYDIKGVSILNIFYSDQSKLPDSWGYIPVLRRVQRFSTAQRDDSLDGSDLRSVNINLFNDPLGFWDFKLVAHKPMLSMITKENPTNTEEDGYIPRIKGKYRIGAQAELRDTFVVELTPKAGDRIYSKIILYIDAATYMQWWAAYYDVQDKVWVVGVHSRKQAESPCGNYVRLTSVEYFNLQSGGSYNLDMFVQEKNVGRDIINEGMFNVRFLSAQGR